MPPAPLDPRDAAVSPAPLDPRDAAVSPAPLDPRDAAVSPAPLDPRDAAVSPAPLDPRDAAVSGTVAVLANPTAGRGRSRAALPGVRARLAGAGLAVRDLP